MPPNSVTGKSRRRFLKVGAAAVAGLGTRIAGQPLGAQEQPVLLPPYLADTNGDGRLGPNDQQLVEKALFSHRGSGLVPRPSFDFRADVLGQGFVNSEALNSVAHSIDTYGPQSTFPIARPITIAWHYGWYNLRKRPPGSQTVRFKGGDYVSYDPKIETLFNDLKNECGVTVDALSWIPKRANYDLINNYRNGYLRALNASTRYVALLYESTLALPMSGDRIDFLSQSVKSSLQKDFKEMARFLLEVKAESQARIFTLDGRPVVFSFGTHTWGLFLGSFRQRSAIRDLVRDVREIFRDIYGEYPYLVGEEFVLSTKGSLGTDRLFRIANFDAIYVYHHAPLKPGSEVTLPMTEGYIQNQRVMLTRAYDTAGQIGNVFTGSRVLIIPNLSPGFAKPGLPTLQIGRHQYADFMKDLRELHLEKYILRYWSHALGSAQLPAPIYIVGSWNEEFEGHAILPAAFNLSLPEVVQHGFDLAMAVKETFSWNHYANRNIESSSGTDGW